MGIGGGIIGGILGGMFGGWWGAAIGAWIGASIGNSDTDQDKQPLETYCDIFRCLGQLAKCDGRVTQDEAELVSNLIKELDIPKDGKSGLKQAFNAGKTQTVHDFTMAIRRIAARIKNMDARRSLLEVFCSLAIVDHSLTQDERILLTIAESELNLPGFLQHFFAGSSSEFSGNAEYASSSGRDSDNAGGRSRFADDVMADAMTLDQCYTTLGCTKDASNEELKRCWRAKAKEFHPDKVAGKGLSAAFIEHAKIQMQKINNAYEAICKSRGIHS